MCTINIAESYGNDISEDVVRKDEELQADSAGLPRARFC